MRIIHFSDTHLGYAEYHALDAETGLNRREQDFHEAFRHVVDDVCRKKPDLAIHAGDLFDTVRPSNRAITEAIEDFRRITDAGIELVVIAGNHDTPRIRATGNILRALQAALPKAHIVFDGEYRPVDLAGATVHAVADAATEEGLQQALESVRAKPGRMNILVLHAGTSRLRETVQSGEFNQHYVPHDLLARFADFDYIAFGHYHRHMPVEGTPNGWYCGSTERTSLSEARVTPGYAEVDLRPLRVRHVAIPVRPMLDFGALPCQGLTDTEILAKLRETLEGKIDGAIARVVLARISPPALAALNPEELARLKKPALHCEIIPDVHQEGRRPGGDPLTIGSLPVEFERFLKTYKLEAKYDRQAIQALGLEYLAKASQESAE